MSDPRYMGKIPSMNSGFSSLDSLMGRNQQKAAPARPAISTPAPRIGTMPISQNPQRPSIPQNTQAPQGIQQWLSWYANRAKQQSPGPAPVQTQQPDLSKPNIGGPVGPAPVQKPQPDLSKPNIGGPGPAPVQQAPIGPTPPRTVGAAPNQFSPAGPQQRSFRTQNQTGPQPPRAF